MKILVCSSNYPSNRRPQVGTFVYELVQEFVGLQNEVVVISPQNISLLNYGPDNQYGDEKATVYRPKKISLSNRKLGFIDTFSFSRFFYALALRKCYEKIEFYPDIIYCHFLISGLNFFQAIPDSNIPFFVAVGEYHNIDIIRNKFSNSFYHRFLNRVSGFIAVSKEVEQKLLGLGVPQAKIIVEPNATDLGKFRPRKKEIVRVKLDLPLDKKIILFVGRFLENKGPLRVQQALNRVDEDTVAVFIGQGPQQPVHDKIIFSGTVSHDMVAAYMAAADVFVLPTLHEGSSNVIVEAMASGLPIVSSNISEIRAQCKPQFSILVDPMNPDEISLALNKILSNDNLRENMSKLAIEESNKYDLNLRARRILGFMSSHV